MVGYGGKDLQKRKVLSLEWKSERVMDDESGESMEPMEEVPLIQLMPNQQCQRTEGNPKQNSNKRFSRVTDTKHVTAKNSHMYCSSNTKSYWNCFYDVVDFIIG